VLIQGESGTGKEVVAHAVHQNSPRRDRPFVPVNCAAIPEALLESELFGYERGAFTGAQSRRQGMFESANGGTLFLDEVGEIPMSVQVKLLRVIELKEFTRLGASSPIHSDIRILAATNRDLEQAVEDGLLREDFYYRLNVVSIRVPPLRRRLEDIPVLVKVFVREFAVENQKEEVDITQEAMDALLDYPWPGNVRELRNCIESTMVKMKGSAITLGFLPSRIQGAKAGQKAVDVHVGMSMAEVERRMIQETLSDAGDNQTRAAGILKIGLRTLQRKLKKYGLS